MYFDSRSTYVVRRVDRRNALGYGILLPSSAASRWVVWKRRWSAGAYEVVDVRYAWPFGQTEE